MLTVFIGNKLAKEIVEGILNEFKSNPMNIELKARGKFISKAVDVLEILKRELNISNSAIKTKTDDLTSREGKPIKVSQITINLQTKELYVKNSGDRRVECGNNNTSRQNRCEDEGI